MRYGVTARRKRNMRRVPERATMRRERRETRRVEGVATMAAQDTKSSGALVIEAERIGKSYGGRPVVKDFSTRVMRGDRVGVVGANGAGKTTLIELLPARSRPIRHRAARDQRRDGQARPTAGVAAADDDAVRRADRGRLGLCAGQRRPEARRLLYQGFPVRAGAGVRRSNLSGGERGRLMLARAVAQPSNLIVLDEPTNDLDMETLELFEELLADYAGRS